MLWLRLPWFNFSVYYQDTPIEAHDVFVRMGTPQLVMMGDRIDMLEYGQRFYPEQQRAQEGIVAMKWATPLVYLSDYVHEFSGIEFENYRLDYWEPNIARYPHRGLVSYDFPEDIDTELVGPPHVWERGYEHDYSVPNPIRSIGWCELQQISDGTLRWRWGADYPDNLWPAAQPSTITEETPFVPDDELLRLVQLDDWPTGEERLIRMHPHG